MNNLINKNNYTNCCDYIDDAEFYIKDQKNGRSMISNKDDYHLKVINKKNQTISFLKIDKCVFNDNDEEKCDCALANNHLIYFIEIKKLELFDNSKKSHLKKK